MKKENTLTKVEGEVYSGDLHVNLSLLTISKPERQTSPKPDRRQTPRRVTELEGGSISNFSSLNFQMLLYIEKAMNIQPVSNRARNIFIRYKVYGTTEVIETTVNWGECNPRFEHKMILPLSFELIQKMVNFFENIYSTIES